MRKHHPRRAPVQACLECSEGLHGFRLCMPRLSWRARSSAATFCHFWLALTIRIAWCPHWQGISCALQSPRYGLLYCHFLEGRKDGRKEGRKEGRMTCVCKSFPIYFNLFWYPSAHAYPVSPSTHAIPILVCCVLNSWQKKIHCNGCMHLPTDTVAMAFFLLNKKQFGALRISQTRNWAPYSNWNTLRDHSMFCTGHGQCSYY